MAKQNNDEQYYPSDNFDINDENTLSNNHIDHELDDNYQDLYEVEEYHAETPYDYYQQPGYVDSYDEQEYQPQSDYEVNYQDQGYQEGYQTEFSEFDSGDNGDQYNKVIIPIAIIGAVLVVLIGFYILRAIGTFNKDSKDANVSFEKETKSIKVEFPQELKTTNEKSSQGTVSVKTTARLQGRKPGLTTVNRTKIPTTSTEVNISEREIDSTATIPSTQGQSTDAIQDQPTTTSKAQENVEKSTISPTTTPMPATAESTIASTTTQIPTTTKSTTVTTTTQNPITTKTPTTSKTKATTSSPTKSTKPIFPMLIIPDPVDIDDDQAKLPKTNPLSKDAIEIFKDLPKEAIANRLVEKYALLKNKNTFEITNKDGTEEYSVSDISIDKLVSFNDNVAFFLASDQLYSFNLYDQELKQIENNVSVDYKEASFHAFDSESILIYSDEEIYESSLDRPSLTLVLDDVTDLKVRGKLYSFIHDEKIKFIDLSKSIPKSGPEELIESRVSKYQISPNGNSLTYISNNKVYTLKDNKIYQYTDNSVDFALTNNPDIILVYTDDKELIVVEIKDKPLVKSIYENVDKETLTENLTLDYGDNCAYVDVEDFKIIYEDEKTETVTLPKVTEPED